MRKVSLSSLLVGTALVSGLVPLLLDSTIYIGFVASRISVSSLVLAALSVLGLVLVNSWQPGQFHRFGQVLLFIVYPLLAVAVIFLWWQERQQFPNYVFSQYHLVLGHLHRVAVYVAISGAALLNWPRVVANSRRYWLVTPFWGWLTAVTAYFASRTRFIGWGEKDAWVEIATFGVFLAMAGLAAVSSIRLRGRLNRRSRHSILPWLVVVVALGSLILAGEEISWGQRIFGIETPAVIVSVNQQAELNFHNIRSLMPLVYWGYLLISLFSAIGWLFRQRLIRLSPADWWRELVETFTPAWYLTTWFWPMALYASYRTFVGPLRFKIWEELAELTLAVGLLAWVYYNIYARFNRIKQRGASRTSRQEQP